MRLTDYLFIVGLFIAGGIIIASCGSSSKSVNAPAPTTIDTLVYLQTGACHGTCPVYDAIIYNTGDIYYVGDRFTPYIGPHLASLSDKDQHKLRAMIQSMERTELQSKYPGPKDPVIYDLPSYRLIIDHDSVQNDITIKGGRATDEIHEFIDYVMRLLADQKYRQPIK